MSQGLLVIRRVVHVTVASLHEGGSACHRGASCHKGGSACHRGASCRNMVVHVTMVSWHEGRSAYICAMACSHVAEQQMQVCAQIHVA